MTSTIMPGEPASGADLTPLALVTCRLRGCRHRACRLAARARRRTVPLVPSAGSLRRKRVLPVTVLADGANVGSMP
jgi:hypothetical protein